MSSGAQSIDYWYQLMTGTQTRDGELVEKMVVSLESEYPRLCSLIMERACNLQCKHCIFQREFTSEAISKSVDLSALVLNIIKQMSPSPVIVHEGRIMRDWHLGVFVAARKNRPDARIGMIDNGTFLRHEKIIKEHKFKFDWLDISLDGTKEIHNAQRNSSTAFDQAMTGVKRAREFVRAPAHGGKVTSLFTVTSFNFSNVYATAALLLKNNLVDEFHITPFSPVRPEIKPLFFAPRYQEGIVDDCVIWWEQVKQIWGDFQNKTSTRIFVRIYQDADLKKIALVVGKEKFWAAFTDAATVRVDQGSISFVIDGVRITYVPLSICPSETFVIDADGAYRMAYCLQYTLGELKSGRSKFGDDVTAYTVATLTLESDFKFLFKRAVRQWLENFGYQYLEQEFKLFQEIKIF